MKKSKFLKSYSIFIAVMLVLSLAAILYIRGLLVKYEASQPERKVEEQIGLLEDAARTGKIENVISFDGYKPESDEKKASDISAYVAKLAGGNLRYEEQPSVTGVVYNITSGNETLAKVTLESVETKTKLIVFNFEKWEVKSLEPAIIDKALELPAAIGIKVNGEAISGTKNEETGMVTYNICSLTTPEIILCDVAGNETKFDASKAVTTYGYSISAPSNYTVYANTLVVDTAVAKSEPIADYEYVYEYCDKLPTQLTYDLYFLSNDVDFKITDNLGADVDFEMENRKILLEGQASQGGIPDAISAQIDVMDAAQQWSLFMTDDLQGTNNGYSTINKLLIDDSYLQSVAWKWATGIDITFTSLHNLGPVPFLDQEISNYVSYGENCFSCTVKFKKHMLLIGRGNIEVMDPMDSTFYFVNMAEEGEAPLWLIADIRENVSK